MQFLPGTPVDQTNTATDDPAPSLQAGASPLLRAGPPAPHADRYSIPYRFSRLGTLPLAHPHTRTGRTGGCLPTFRARAADQAHVAYVPDTTWPVSGHPPDSSRANSKHPVLMSPNA